MKDYQIHLINAGIAGLLVFFGSLTPLLVGDMNVKGFLIGAGAGAVTGTIVFLNKMQQWISTQDPDCKPKLFHFL